ncbi:MAG: tRNA 2-thiouridine(34) synthase MnmA [Desulfobacteraceae bacterium 4572_130]|nr:MAG: tRNA 2-thiouridine(34) synthase MnmA [Desulfobacteraceae bacterium 4572_130]
MKKTIAISLSGGIDSLVAGFLLKKKKINLFGIHFTTGYEKNSIDFSNLEKILDIKIYHINLRKIFKESIVTYFIESYLNGKTPNPCLICNKKIKFGALLKAANNLGADFIATGHYAKIKTSKIKQSKHVFLVKGKDSVKDQSYFLSMLEPSQLKKIIFPLGDMTKSEVTELAKNKGLVPPSIKESQDICFIHNKSFYDFISLEQKFKSIHGDIVTLDNKIIGTHKGLYRFTIGQRKGINCPGSAPYYVKKIDIKNNKLIVGFKNDLLQKKFYVKDLNWITKPFFHCSNVKTKIRYNHKEAESVLTYDNNNSATIIFKKSQYAITPGQVAVFYNKDIVLGAGIIQ